MSKWPSISGQDAHKGLSRAFRLRVVTSCRRVPNRFRVRPVTHVFQDTTDFVESPDSAQVDLEVVERVSHRLGSLVSHACNEPQSSCFSQHKQRSVFPLARAPRDHR